MKHAAAVLILSLVPSLFAQANSPATSGVGPAIVADLKQVARRLPHDQLAIYKSPVTVFQQPSNWRFLVPFAIAGAFIPADRHISASLPTTGLGTSQHISDVGLYGTAASLVGFYIYGAVNGDVRARETGVLGAESFVNSIPVYALTNVISGRQRPLEGNGHGDFFVDHALNTSFPSGHATSTWSMATVIAHEYPSVPSQVLWYAVGSTVAITRVTGQRHFVSDVIVGSTFGYLIGRYIFRAHHGAD